MYNCVGEVEHFTEQKIVCDAVPRRIKDFLHKVEYGQLVCNCTVPYII